MPWLRCASTELLELIAVDRVVEEIGEVGPQLEPTAGSTLLNLRVGREWKHWSLYLDVLNALDSQDHDIDYYFPSRLRDEPPVGVDDVHFHVFEPRALRLSLRYAF